MDETLNGRYNALLYGYDSGGTGLLAELKSKILSRPDLLRSDGALCLLTLFDQMIVRPYMGQIFSSEGHALPVPKIASDNFGEHVRKSLWIIIDNLQKNGSKEPRSSHEVLTAINAVWAELSELLFWG
jgi:hypothetical protein